MKNNINFDDTLKVFSDLDDQFASLATCVDNFTKGSISELSNTFLDITSVGTTLKTALIGISDAVSSYKMFDDAQKAVDGLKKGYHEMLPSINDFIGFSNNLIPTIVQFCSSLTPATIAQGLYATGANIATAAQVVWNTAVMLFPAVLVIAAIAAVVVGIVAFVKHINESSEGQKKLNAETTALKPKTTT